MNITFKLYAGLTEYLPPDVRSGNQMPLEVPEGATIARAIEPFGLPAKLVHLVLVNGMFVCLLLYCCLGNLLATFGYILRLWWL